MRATPIAGLLTLSAASMLATVSPAVAKVIVYDNSAGTFVWTTHSSSDTSLPPGNYLDITQPPTQSGEATSYGIRKITTASLFSFGHTYFGAESGAKVAVDSAPVVFVTPDKSYFSIAAATFAPTVPIGSGGEIWSAHADFRTLQILLLGETATIAVRLALPSGMHNGWIRLQLFSSSYRPLEWGYETEPMVPILTPGAPDADDVLHVPGEYPSIRSAMNRALDGQQIVVADGTYSGYNSIGIDFHGKAVTLRSANGPQPCILDGNDLNRGAYFHESEGPDSILDGFTITDCTAWGPSGVGGGGGIKCDGSNPTIRNCIIRSNTAKENPSTQPVGSGGGLHFTNSAPTVVNCLIAGNSSTSNGGVVGSTAHFVNCTITNNNTTSLGGGAPIAGGATYHNCIFFNNLSATVSAVPPEAASITFSCVQGGFVGEGNIDAIPMFEDPDGPDGSVTTVADNDYHLAPGSPCIDAASNPAVPRGITEDLEGNPRFQDDPATTDTGLGRAPIVDMGAYEFQPPLDPADLDEDGDVDGFDLALLLGAWGPCPKSGECPADLFAADGAVNGLDLAYLLGHWT